MERRGSGFKKICEDYAFAEGYTEKKTPRFKSDNDNFTLILPNLNYNPEKGQKKGPENKGQKKGPEKRAVRQEIIQRVNDVLDIIKNEPTISRVKIAEQMGISEKKVRVAIEHLIAEKIIVHDGPDKGGKWIIL